MNFPHSIPYTLKMLEDWCATYKPLMIEMTDKQYSWFAHLMQVNARDFKGIPIRFTEAPQAV